MNIEALLPINTYKNKNLASINHINNQRKKPSNNVISFKGDSFSSSDVAKSNFYNSICGYQADKEEFYDSYLKSLFNSTDSINVEPSVLICGPDESILNNFIESTKAVANSKGLNCVDISKDIEDNDFANKLMEQLMENIKYYEKNKNRSIIFINNPEKFLGMNVADTKSRTSISFDEADMSILTKNKNYEVIARFKSILDNCHYLPNDSISGNATTIIFNSTNPHLIHPDLRDGKMSKMYIDIAKDDNFIHLLTEQLNDVKKSLIENPILHLSTTNADSGILKDYAEKVKTIEIPDGNMSSYLLNVFTSPNQFTGGYSYKSLYDSIKKACVKSTESLNPIPFVAIFANIISKTPRDISPQQIVKYNKIKDSFIKKLDEYEELIALNEDGMLNNQEQNKLSKLIEYEKNILDHLGLKRKNGIITPDEEIMLSKLIKRYTVRL